MGIVLWDAERCVAISPDGLWWTQWSLAFDVRYGGTADGVSNMDPRDEHTCKMLRLMWEKLLERKVSLHSRTDGFVLSGNPIKRYSMFPV